MTGVSHQAVLDLFEGKVSSHGEYGLAVGREAEPRVAAGLKDTLGLARTRQRVPLVDGAFHAAGHQAAVIATPGDGAYLRTRTGMAAEMAAEIVRP